MNNLHSVNKIFIFSFFWKIIKPYKWYIMLSLQAPVIGAIFIPVYQYAIKLIIDSLVEKKFFFVLDLIIPITLLVGGHIILELLWRISNIADYKSLPFIKTDITHNAYSHITNNSYKFFQNNLSGTISAKINNIEVGAYKIFNNFRLNIIHPISMILVTLFFLYSVSPIFVPLMLVFYLIFFPTVYLLSKKASYISECYTNHKQTISGLIVDSISNIVSVFLFANREQERKSIRGSLNKLLSTEQTMIKYEFILHLFIGLIYILMSAGILFLLIYLRQKGLITIGDFALVLGMLSHMLEVAYILVMHVKDIIKDIGELKESFSVFNKQFIVADDTNAKSLILKNPTIDFYNVTFGYDDTKIFKGLNLRIHAGEKVGFIGSSGAGKSTLINILLKNFEIDSGEILINGQDISYITRDSLSQQITVIPQDTMLFHRSIKENISYGKLGATDEEIVVASKKAYIHEFIKNLPEGYDTTVGERGVKLSGGQKQRIVIARAILKDSPILILDEATSSLDGQTEQYIQASLDLLIADKKKTVIAIAHRLSALKHMDRIIVIDKGKILEEGQHDQLITNTKSLYRKLWKLQEI